MTLATAGLAYVIAVRVLAWTGERAGVSVPSEIEPVLIVLLLGVVTDYTVFFMSETRRRLPTGRVAASSPRAAATARIAPLVLAAGLLVAAGAVSLLAGEMQFFRVFGPGARGHRAGRDARLRDARAGADGAPRAVAVRPARPRAARAVAPPLNGVRRPQRPSA